uniref:DUF1624 domain-containing protein n=1 Tax=Archaeoglobus fulgidus TaxID=2234 RepID=A0A7J2TIZ1_ARCFL
MRYWQIDFARGIAAILMLVFHFFFDASYFGKIELEGFFWFIFPRIIGGMFIFISGFTIGQTLKGFNLKRFLKFSAIALAITAVTFIFTPEEFVIFGIIHFFALASILAVPFSRRPRICLIFGIKLVLIGIYIQQFRFPFYHFLWLGIVPEGFRTLDYYPLLPWFGFMLIGIYFGRKVKIKASNYKGGLVSFLGRNSLKIYLIQHPVILLILQILYGDIIFRVLRL